LNFLIPGRYDAHERVVEGDDARHLLSPKTYSYAKGFAKGGGTCPLVDIVTVLLRYKTGRCGPAHGENHRTQMIFYQGENQYAAAMQAQAHDMRAP